MAVILCPKCGKENPDSLRVCQYCQTPLSSGSTVRIGDKPTKKNTGELEPFMPDWLRDVRQQARDLAEKDAAEAASMPKIQKEEPPDLLAGLASQASKPDEDELPDWLAGLTPKKEEKPASTAPAKPASDFFAQFEKSAATPKSEPKPPPSSKAAPEPPPVPPQRDELSDWFAKASEEPSEPFALASDASELHLDWSFEEELSPKSSPESEAPVQEEDLSWLHNLEAEAKKTGELAQSRQADQRSSGIEKPAEPGSTQDDLSWLDSLGGLPTAGQPRQEPPRAEEDLDWLNAFGATPQATQPPAAPAPSQDDLSWLDNLGTPARSEQPAAPDERPEEDLGWLNAFPESPAAPQDKDIPPASKKDDLGGASEPAADDISWLRGLQGTPGTFSGALTDSAFEQGQSASAAAAVNMPHVSPFTPRQTAPLDDKIGQQLPDWLKSATEEPSMPLGPQALDRMRDDKKAPPVPDENTARALFGTVIRPKDEQPVVPEQAPAPVEPVARANEEAGPLYSEVNSLFSDELPDWLSNPEPADSQPVEEIGVNAEGGDALSPAELPSWVQAMRPVEAVIATEAAAGLGNLPVERDGPLAGLQGVIPLVAIGSLRRPRPVPLTLQTTEEQQTSATVLEQILQRETTARSLSSAPAVASQQTLRWIIAGLLVFVLAAVLFSGTQIMPISPVLPLETRNITNAVMSLADNAPVLVVMDYQPGLAGEMEAVSGPLLDQMVRLHHPYLSFVATSPSGSALVERLLANTNINQPGGAGYVVKQNYDNLGYLPGGEAGVAAFLQSPQTTLPSLQALRFSGYAAVLLLSDHADSARTWVEQISILKQADPTVASQPLLAVASAQTAPMLEPYFSSGQITGMISGLPSASTYEALNDGRPGMARTYWDAFGVGMMMAVFLIVVGSLWSVYSGIRASRMKTVEE
jgi:hypothetical protein